MLSRSIAGSKQLQFNSSMDDRLLNRCVSAARQSEFLKVQPHNWEWLQWRSCDTAHSADLKPHRHAHFNPHTHKCSIMHTRSWKPVPSSQQSTMAELTKCTKHTMQALRWSRYCWTWVLSAKLLLRQFVECPNYYVLNMLLHSPKFFLLTSVERSVSIINEK